MTKPGLGTAQFGIDHGVSNRRGQCLDAGHGLEIVTAAA